MENKSGLCEDDVLKLEILIHLAADNQWYALASKLVDAREEMKKKIRDAWSHNILETITTNT